MSWKFNISEQSLGQYLCTGVRDSGQTVKAHCAENEIGKVFEFAFDLEVKLGTDPACALFQVTKGAKTNWTSRYDGHAFGSWSVESTASGKDRIVYDGKESWIAVYCGNEEPNWQSAFRSAKDVDSAFFKLLAASA